MVINFLQKITGPRCIFPFYHVVSDTPLPHLEHVYRITSKIQFVDDLEFLLKHFKPLHLHDFLHNPHSLHQKNAFHLTFDDGLQQMHEIVAPVLRSKGIPATFFINPSFVDNKDLFYRYKQSLILHAFQNQKLSVAKNKKLKTLLGINNLSFQALKEFLLYNHKNDENIITKLAGFFGVDFGTFLQREKPYLSVDQIHSLLNNGFTIGAHSMDHPFYPSITLDEQVKQTRESLDFVQKKFDLPYRLFAFPFTDHGVSDKFFDYFYSHKQNMDYSFGTAGLKDDVWERHIQRIPVESFRNAQHAVTREYSEYIVKRILNLHKTKR